MKTFSQCSFDARPDSDPSKRLLSALQSIGAQHLFDRHSILFDRPWAKECIAKFDPEHPEQLIIQIFPGNTKGQGWALYQLNPEWVTRNTVVVDGITFNVCVSNHTKFMHIQGNYITSVDFPMSDAPTCLLKPIHTLENQRNIAGRWYRQEWPQLDKLLSEYFNFNWKTDCGFTQHFINTGKNQLDLAIGYSVSMSVPYQYLQQLDVDQNTHVAVGQFVLRCMNELISLVEGKTK